jgi:1,4-alpha-glucan branching enzyme
MQQMVRDINHLRWSHGALRGSAGSVVHVDEQNQVVAFKRWNLDGDVVLVVINPGDSQWGGNQYNVNMGGESGSWREIFNSQAPEYGGINTVGNYGQELQVNSGQLGISLPSWGVLVFGKV